MVVGKYGCRFFVSVEEVYQSTLFFVLLNSTAKTQQSKTEGGQQSPYSVACSYATID